MKEFIHQNQDWPDFRWQNDALLAPLSEVRNLQGRLVGNLEVLGFELLNQANLETLTLDVIKSSEIEGKVLNPRLVRSSIALRLGLEKSGISSFDRDIEGVVDMLLDATQNFAERSQRRAPVQLACRAFPNWSQWSVQNSGRSLAR